MELASSPVACTRPLFIFAAVVGTTMVLFVVVVALLLLVFSLSILAAVGFL